MSLLSAHVVPLSVPGRKFALALICALSLATAFQPAMAQDQRQHDASATDDAPLRAVAASVSNAAPSESALNSNPAATDLVGDTSVFDELQINRVLAAINQARARDQVCGSQRMAAVAPIRWDASTVRAARAQALFLQQSNQFGHVGQNGSHVGDRLKATGYEWQKVGENLAAGFNSIEEVVISWLASPSHCRVLMTPEFTVAGVSFVAGEDENTYANYWALVMAAPRMAN